MKKIHLNIVGVGGTGAWFAEQIMRTAINMRVKDKDTIVFINLIDNDVVELKNLIRQHFVGTETLGQLKVDVLRMLLEKIYAAAVAHIGSSRKVSGDLYMPQIRIDAHPILVMEDEEGELPDAVKALLFPRNSQASITVMCVDNNLTRRTLEKHYHRNSQRYTAFNDLSVLFTELEPAIEHVSDCLTKKDKSVRSNVILVEKEGVTCGTPLSISDKSIVIGAGCSLSTAKAALGKTGNANTVQSIFGFINAGNDDEDFQINGALGAPLADYTHVYDSDLSVPDALRSCADAEESTPVPQTTTMNMMAATHLVGVVAQWLTTVVTLDWTTCSRFDGESNTSVFEVGILADGPVTEQTQRAEDGTIAGASSRITYVPRFGELPADASITVLSDGAAVECPSLPEDVDKVLFALLAQEGKVLSRDKLTLAGLTVKDTAIALSAIKGALLLDGDAFAETYLARMDAVDTLVDGVVISGKSTHSRLLARGRKSYANFAKILKASITA